MFSNTLYELSGYFNNLRMKPQTVLNQTVGLENALLLSQLLFFG